MPSPSLDHWVVVKRIPFYLELPSYGVIILMLPISLHQSRVSLLHYTFKLTFILFRINLCDVILLFCFLCKDQVVDVFTELLSETCFQFLHDKLKVHESP